MIVNLTPHPVHIDADGAMLTFPSMGSVRVEEVVGAHPTLTYIDGISVIRKSFGRAVGLPDEQAGVVYIVSQIVKDACPSREDLAVPHDLMRDEVGRIIGCRGLAM